MEVFLLTYFKKSHIITTEHMNTYSYEERMGGVYMTTIILELEGLDCAGCADDIVEYSKKIDGVRDVSLNFVNKKMRLEIGEDGSKSEIIKDVKKKMSMLEPHVVIRDLTADRKTKSQKEEEIEASQDKGIDKSLIQILLAGTLFGLAYLLKLEAGPRLLVFLVSYLIVGSGVIRTALLNIRAGNPMDEHFLMTVATLGAFIIGEYPEGVAVMLFYQIGEYFQSKAVNHSRESIAELMDIRPDYANLVQGDTTIKVDPEDVKLGDIILIKPGEKVALDGLIIEGESTLDTSNITGESIPTRVKAGDQIVSGVVNNSGLLELKVEKEFGDSTITKILNLVENASSKKAATENFITKFARYYTPVVVYLALAIGILPPLLMGGEWSAWAYKAFVFLVISCPCALVISIPLGFFGGIGAASKEGVLIKGGNYLEALNDVNTVVFDKTGTITKGSFEVSRIISHSDLDEDDLLEMAAYAESYSNHPIARSIIDYYAKDIDKSLIEDYEDIAGKGIRAFVSGVEVLVGNEKLLVENGIDLIEEEAMGTIVYLASEGRHLGTIIVADELKENIIESIRGLKDRGIKTIMLSGDNKETVREVAQATGINEAHGELLPQDKVDIFEDILANNKKDKKVVFVGDGVNDAPVLARADIGIAMGGLGSDAAIEASDIVIMTDEIGKISTGMKIASKTKRIVTQNIILALGIKLVVLSLGLFDMASMWQAVFADVGVTIIAIFNSIRALKVEK